MKTVFQDFEELPEPVRRVMVDMRFNLGSNRFRKFRKMIMAVENRDFIKAAAEMKNSRWYNQVGHRAQTLVNMITEV